MHPVRGIWRGSSFGGSMKEKRKPRPWLKRFVVGVILLAVGYPLTWPIMTRLAEDGYLPKAASVIYEPIWEVLPYMPIQIHDPLWDYFYWLYPSYYRDYRSVHTVPEWWMRVYPKYWTP